MLEDVALLIHSVLVVLGKAENPFPWQIGDTQSFVIPNCLFITVYMSLVVTAMSFEPALESPKDSQKFIQLFLKY